MAASIAPVPAQAFTLDGVLSTGEAAAYTNEFDLTFELEGNGGKTVNGGSIRIGRDGSDGDIFMLVDVPIEITDVVYGDPANSPGSGWGTGNKHNYDKLAGSDAFQFTLATGNTNNDVKVELIKKTKKGEDPNAILDDIKSDGNGLLLDAETSLQFNLRNGFGDKTNSPDPILGTPPADWVQAVQYEFQFDGSLFASGTTILIEDISDIVLHSSPTKGGFDKVVTVSCTGDCTPTTTTTVPEPGALSVLGVGLIGLAYLRRRRKLVG